jgi:hypothetical protein
MKRALVALLLVPSVGLAQQQQQNIYQPLLDAQIRQQEWQQRQQIIDNQLRIETERNQILRDIANKQPAPSWQWQPPQVQQWQPQAVQPVQPVQPMQWGR